MHHERIFGHIPRAEFVGREAELRQVISYATESPQSRLLVAAAPNSGGSEFLRQTYDELFFRRTQAVPFYFAFPARTGRLTDVAVEFFRAFLQQYVAYRRVDPSLCRIQLTLQEIPELTLPTDYDAVTSLLEIFEREQSLSDDSALFKLCLSAPQKLAVATKRPVLPLIDCLKLASETSDSAYIANIAKTFLRSGEPGVFAALRRQMPLLSHVAGADLDAVESVHLDYLAESDANLLLDSLTRSARVKSNEQTRDLIVQQLRGSPFFLAALTYGAREKRVAVTTFLDCQKLYVDELLGGRIDRHFSNLLTQIAPMAQT